MDKKDLPKLWPRKPANTILRKHGINNLNQKIDLSEISGIRIFALFT